MCNHQPLGRKVCVPARLLTVLDSEILVRISVIIDNKCLTIVTHRHHIGDNSILFCQNGRLLPSAHHFFVSCISCRAVSITVIATTTHQVKITHTKPSAIINVIKVGKPHTMAELMTEASDTLNSSIWHNFVTAGIGIYLGVIQCKAHSCFRQKVHMGPDSIGVTAVSLSFSCIEHEHFFCLAIAIPVIVGKVHIIIGFFASLYNHVFCMHVIAITIVLTVILIVV